MRLAAALLVLLLAGLVAALLGLPAVGAFDSGLNAAFGPWRAAPLLAVFVWLTGLGAGPAIAAVALSASGLLWASRQRRLLEGLWVAWLGAEATVWSLKFAVGRARPVFLDVATAASPSFPSGHAALSLAVYGFLAWAVARQLARRRDRRAVAGAAAAIIAAIAFSRLYLGVHYGSDVLAGLLIGGFWLLMGAARARVAPWPNPPS